MSEKPAVYDRKPREWYIYVFEQGIEGNPDGTRIPLLDGPGSCGASVLVREVALSDDTGAAQTRWIYIHDSHIEGRTDGAEWPGKDGERVLVREVGPRMSPPPQWWQNI